MPVSRVARKTDGGQSSEKAMFLPATKRRWMTLFCLGTVAWVAALGPGLHYFAGIYHGSREGARRCSGASLCCCRVAHFRHRQPAESGNLHWAASRDDCLVCRLVTQPLPFEPLSGLGITPFKAFITCNEMPRFFRSCERTADCRGPPDVGA